MTLSIQFVHYLGILQKKMIKTVQKSSARKKAYVFGKIETSQMKISAINNQIQINRAPVFRGARDMIVNYSSTPLAARTLRTSVGLRSRGSVAVEAH